MSHLLIVSMDYLTRRYNINARVALTVHDEIRYLVKSEDRYRAAMALQVANVWTRAMFSQQMGINDLPQSCAYFSAVDVDHVLRKEVDMDCVTPSHPDKIAPGESLDIQQLLAKGVEAKLDPDVVSRDMPAPEKYSYTPREPVMAALQKLTDTNYVRAQIATDEELKQLVKEYRSPSKASSVEDEMSTLQDMFDAPTTSKKRTSKSPKAEKKPKPFKQKPFKKMTTPKHLQPQGVHLPEVPSWHEHRLAGFDSSAAKRWAYSNNGTPGRTWSAKTAGY